MSDTPPESSDSSPSVDAVSDPVRTYLEQCLPPDPPALDDVEARLAQSPDDPAVLEWYAQSLYSARRFSESVAIYDHLLKAAPTTLHWLLERSNACYLLDDVARAKDGWEEILEYSPHSRIGVLAHGLLHKRPPEIPQGGPRRVALPTGPARPAVGPVQKNLMGELLATGPGDRGGAGRVPQPVKALVIALAAFVAMYVTQPGPETPPASATASPSSVATAAPQPEYTVVPGLGGRPRRRRVRPTPQPPPPGQAVQEQSIRRYSTVFLALGAGVVAIMALR